MASNSNPISSNLPPPISPTPFQSHSWYQWSVSYLTVKTAIVGAVGVLVALTLYRRFYSSENTATSEKPDTTPTLSTIVPKDTTGKTLPTPVPVNEATAQAFIRINKKLFHTSDAAKGYDIKEIRVRIEDSKGRRIATRYLPDFEGDYDIFSFLPLKQTVTLKFKITREHRRWNAPIINGMEPLKFEVVAESALYRVGSQPNTYTRFECYPTETAKWQPRLQEAKTTLCATGLSLMSGNVIVEDLLPPDQKAMNLKNFDGDVVRRVAIAFKCNIMAKQLSDNLDYAFVGNNTQKSLPLRLMIKDWKAAYQLENGIKIDYKPARFDLAHFHIESLTCATYLDKK
jgi:hypothetical protein